MRKNSPVMLDVDGVLADFSGGVAAEWGITPAEFYAAWPPGEWWGCLTALSAVTGRPWTEDEFWECINGKDGEFWHALRPLPHAVELFTAVTSMTDEWAFLTAPSRCDYCPTGKRRWIRKHFGKAAVDRVILTPHKHYLARPGTVLIDDSEANCDRFTGKNPGIVTGANAILYPAHHNPLHPFKDDPLAHVIPFLENHLS